MYKLLPILLLLSNILNAKAIVPSIYNLTDENIVISTPTTSEYLYNDMNNSSINITKNGSLNIVDSEYAIMIGFMNGSSYIKNEGSINIYNNDFTPGILAHFMQDNSSIINVGEINTHNDYFGIGIFAHKMYDNASIINLGNINVYDGEISAGIAVSIMKDNSFIVNSGQINVDSKLNLEDIMGGIIVEKPKNNNLITNTGLIKATINNKLDQKAYSIWIRPDFTSQLRVNNSGKLYGNLNGNLAITNSGVITLPSNSVGKNQVKIKSLNQSSKGILNISVKDDKEYSQFSAENVTIQDGSTIGFIPVSNDLNDLVGLSLSDVISAKTDLNVDTSKLTSSAFLDVNFINNGLSLDAKINSVKTASDVLNGIGFSKNQTKMIDKLLNNNYSSMNTFKQALLSSPSKQSLSKLIQESTSEVNSNLSSILQSNFQSTSSLISSRQQTLSGLSSGDGSSLERGFWMKPYHSYTKQDNVNGISGYSLKTSGLGVGIDKEYKANNYYGLALLVSNSDVDMNDVKQYNDVTNFGLMFYSNINNIYENINLYYQLGYSLNDNHSSRYISSIDKTAIGDFKSHVLSLNAKAQKDIRYNEHTIFKPYINTTLLYLNTSSYKESGADSMNLDVESNDDIKFILTLGNEFDYAYTDKTNFKANLSASYDFTNNSSSLTSSYEGASDIVFDTDGLETKALSFNLGLGIDTKYNNATTLSFNYDTNIKQDFINHNLFAKLRVVF